MTTQTKRLAVEIAGKKYSNALGQYQNYLFCGGTDKAIISKLWSNVQNKLKSLHAAQVEFIK